MCGPEFFAGVIAGVNAAAEAGMTPEQLETHRAKQKLEREKFHEEHPHAGLFTLIFYIFWIGAPVAAAAAFGACLFLR